MKTRKVQCIHYICKGLCDLGGEGILYGNCQHCKHYKERRNGKPDRVYTRNQRKDRIMKKEATYYD